MSTTMPRRKLSTAEQRRDAIMEAAERVFAARGLHGTPTLEIAKAAGISQAYLFRLYPTKAALFEALTEHSNQRVYRTFEEAARTARAAGEDVLDAMGQAYAGLLADRTRPAEPDARPRGLRRSRRPRADARELCGARRAGRA